MINNRVSSSKNSLETYDQFESLVQTVTSSVTESIQPHAVTYDEHQLEKIVYALEAARLKFEHQLDDLEQQRNQGTH